MSRHLDEYNRPPNEYQMTTAKALRKRRIALLLLIVLVAAFLALAILISLPSEPQGGVQDYTATATALSLTATAFAQKFMLDNGIDPNTTNVLTHPEVQATSTAMYQQMQTALPSLFPLETPEPVATLPPEP